MSELATNPEVVPVPRYLSYVHSSTKKPKQPYLDAGGTLPGFALNQAGMVLPLGGGQPPKIFISPVVSVKLLTRSDNTGKIVKAYREQDFPKAWITSKTSFKGSQFNVYKDPSEPKEYAEHFYTVVLLRFDGHLWPATMNFLKGPSASGFKNVHIGLTQANDKGRWGALPGYKHTVEALGAAGRIKASLTLEAKENTNTGNSPLLSKTVIFPPTKEEIDQYNSLADNPQFVADVTATTASLNHAVAVALGEVKEPETQDEEV